MLHRPDGRGQAGHPGDSLALLLPCQPFLFGHEFLPRGHDRCPTTPPTRPVILSVGQCGPDHATISRFLARDFAAEVLRAHDFDEALAILRGERTVDLVLVNRETDADGTRGLDLIRTIRTDPTFHGVPVMLVSNYEDAQAQAVALGALPGIGKARLNTPEARDRLASALS
ncbi:MAG: response regulator [Isosphaeraceae bacterium]